MKNITTLQDSILSMKTAFEIVTRRGVEKGCSAELMLKTNENVDKFLKERPSNCSIMDRCGRRVERATSMILRAYMEHGAKSAMEQAKHHAEAATRLYEKIKCSDDRCFKNAISTFKTLEELLEATTEASAKFTRDFYTLEKWRGCDEVREEEICNLLALIIRNTVGKGGANHLVAA